MTVASCEHVAGRRIGRGNCRRVGAGLPRGIAEIERTLPDTLSAAAGKMWRKRTQDFVAEGTPEDFAQRLAALQDLVAAPDIVLVARRTGHPVVEVARTHFAVEDMFRLGVMVGAARGIPVADTYDRLALDALLTGWPLPSPFDRRGPRPWPDHLPRSGRGVEHVARRRSRAHPHGGRGHLCLRIDALQAHRRGELARRFDARTKGYSSAVLRRGWMPVALTERQTAQGFCQHSRRQV